MATPRGIRNNNPGNIERNSTNKWQGRATLEQMTPEQRAETRFEVFLTPAWGIRALAVLLINYQDKYRINSVSAVINRWAPPSENDTQAYIGQVARAVGVEPYDAINLHEYRYLRPLVEAIIQHENGQQPYSTEVIEEGLRLAGVTNLGAERLVPMPKAATAAAATAATAGGIAAIADGMQLALPTLQTFSQVAQHASALPGIARVVVGVLILVCVGSSVYAWWRLRRAREVTGS